MMSSEKTGTRERILAAARTLLEAPGRGPVRMADIANEAGVSRQAVYLHFPNRADLLTATTRWIDELNAIDARLEHCRKAASGRARLLAWIEVWGHYIPTIYGVARALMAMKESDLEAAAAWNDRMKAVREGCAAAITALARDGDLAPCWSEADATDFLVTLLSVRNWEQLCEDCGWSQAHYVERMQAAAARLLVRPDKPPPA